nr:immunoglobulin light chain junction region [Macaca mulatta]
CQHTFDTPFTF